ncbi:MAG: hypothetical protein ACFFBP_03300 [Promethearchaeota archaeon]
MRCESVPRLLTDYVPKRHENYRLTRENIFDYLVFPISEKIVLVPQATIRADYSFKFGT